MRLKSSRWVRCGPTASSMASQAEGRSLSHEAQAGEDELRSVVDEAGFRDDRAGRRRIRDDARVLKPTLARAIRPVRTERGVHAAAAGLRHRPCADELH